MTNHAKEANRRSKNVRPMLSQPKQLWNRIHGMNDLAVNFEKLLFPDYSIEPNGFFGGAIILVEDGWSGGLVTPVYRNKSFTVRIQAQCSNRIRKIL